MLQGVGRGLKAMAEMAVVRAGGPPSPGDKGSGAELPAMEPELARTAAATAKARTAATYTAMRNRREERLAEARIAAGEAATARADTLAQKRVEEADARIADRNERRRMQAEREKERGAKPSGGGGRGTARRRFTWVHPQSGESYSVDRDVWDKSIHTLYDMVVEGSCPEPDSRGYPNAKEWRRHCDTNYNTRAHTRENFVITHLPGNEKALEYLKTLTRKR